jgi:16S rRNA pseudouridine516 synthase
VPAEGARVFDLLPPRWRARAPTVTSVGRLDKDTTGALALAPGAFATRPGRSLAPAPGALLLTDLGELVQRWTTPKRKARTHRARAETPTQIAQIAHIAHLTFQPPAQVPKLYEATLASDLPAGAAGVFATGEIILDGAPCAPALLEPTGPRSARVTLTEGRYHQVKRMFGSQARCTPVCACFDPSFAHFRH